MSKTYILQKDITSPLLSVKAGEPVRKEEGIEYYSIGDKRYYFESKYVENNPEWFLPEENKSNDSFQWDEKLVEEFAMGFLASRTASKMAMEQFKNDDRYKQSRCEVCGVPVKSGAMLCGEHWKQYTPKPQAENKPDWEIVAFKKNNIVYRVTNDGLFDVDDLPFRDVQSKEELIRNGYQIHSVKRLSDGEVFSVGDEVVWDLEQCPGNSPKPFKIESFQIVNRKLMYCNNQNIALRYLQKKLPPQPQKEEQRIEADVDLPLGITMREIASCITNYVRKSDSPFLRDNETTVIDHKKLEEVCKTKMRKMFTKQQVDAMCEDVWDAARAKGRVRDIEVYKYEDLEHYKNRKK